MKRTLLKTAACLLIFAVLAALPAGFAHAQGDSRFRPLKHGDSGEAVLQLKRDLRALDLLAFDGEPSGAYDDDTKRAVSCLQRMLGLKADGVYTGSTRRAHHQAVENGILTPFYVEDLPLYGCTVGIDAGHQDKADSTLEPIAPGSALFRFSMTEGCSGIRTKVRESTVNLAVSMSLTKLLKSFGARVVNSRESDDVSISNAERARLMNSSGVDFWLRLHCDSSSDPSVFGARILLPNSIHNFNIASKSALLGRCIIKNYCDTAETVCLVSRSLTSETGFNWSQVPVAALELGYLSNAASDLALSSSEYQLQCAEGILYGIAEYYLEIGAISNESYTAVTGDFRLFDDDPVPPPLPIPYLARALDMPALLHGFIK